MKSVATLLFLLTLAFRNNAQLLDSYPKGVTSRDFNVYYGSLQEYNFQESLKFKSDHKHAIMCIGSKAIYLAEIPKYMVHELGCDRNIDSNRPEYPTVFRVRPGGIFSKPEELKPIDIIADIDDSLRMTKVTIRGNTEYLVKLFLFYWPKPDIKYNEKQFKKGCLFYQDSGSDRISFNWKSATPNITITKNPSFSIPLPLAATPVEMR